MTEHWARQVLRRFGEFADQFEDGFSRASQRQAASQHVEGLLERQRAEVHAGDAWSARRPGHVSSAAALHRRLAVGRARYAGRLQRLRDGRRDVRVYDYAGLNAPMLARMFDRRSRGYEAIGYRILLPASASPGGPIDVVLPSDPVWKRDYSGSVRRLVRDGVDTPLASLFVHVARTVPPD